MPARLGMRWLGEGAAAVVSVGRFHFGQMAGGRSFRHKPEAGRRRRLPVAGLHRNDDKS